MGKVEDARGGASFKKAKGKGSVQLKLVSDNDESARLSLTFRLSVGNPNAGKKRERPRGLVRHNFNERPICGLPKGRDQWDFKKAVDEITHTFVVTLEVLTVLT